MKFYRWLPWVASVFLTSVSFIPYSSDEGISKIHRADSIPQLTALDLTDFEKFRSSIAPLISRMSAHRIIGLGEGTHGTSEFYKLRFWISRILIEDHGFTHVSFENDYGDLWHLNNGLNDTSNLCGLVKKHLYRIWQRQEVLDFFQWLRKWNQQHPQKVVIAGLDYSFLEPDVEILNEIFKDNVQWKQNRRDSLLFAAAHLQDEIWEGRYQADFRTDMNQARKSSRQGYLIVDTLEKLLMQINDTDPSISSPNNSIVNSSTNFAPADARLLLSNLKQGFYPFYARGSELDRDSIMAANIDAHLSQPTDKMIVWAHNAHLSKKPIYGGAVGGMGVFINRSFPAGYFVIGTGTADGSYSGTKEPRPTNENKMEVFKLQKPVAGSWEQFFGKDPVSAGFVITDSAFNKLPVYHFLNNVRPIRFVGYGPDSGKGSYDKQSLSALYDGYIFIKSTKAATDISAAECN